MKAYLEMQQNVVHVEDVAAGHVLALERGAPGEHYVLGGDNLSMRELLALLAEITGIPAPRFALPQLARAGRRRRQRVALRPRDASRAAGAARGGAARARRALLRRLEVARASSASRRAARARCSSTPCAGSRLGRFLRLSPRLELLA